MKKELLIGQCTTKLGDMILKEITQVSQIISSVKQDNDNLRYNS